MARERTPLAVGTIVDDLDQLPDRIRASADRVADLTKQLADEREVRDDLIVQAVDDAGMSQRAVAKAAGVSQPHLIRILAAASER